ncbi:MAG: hypothetical protein LBJ12_04085 [Oscillospiraceae bacterium]|jgi:hypothetical protein|nr:hypothetical protein [Oscillospiraceae bacterium]
MRGNAGSKSRTSLTLVFPNYDRDELAKIFLTMVYRVNLLVTKEHKAEAKKYFRELIDDALKDNELSNARFVQNLYKHI